MVKMNVNPRISVVIACFNQSRELELTLSSFLRQQIPFSQYELIVIDDHSVDYTARDVVARLRQQYPDANLLYLRQYRTDGGSYGSSGKVKNIGIRMSRGEYVFFNNSEIVQAGESLSFILAEMDAFEKPLCLRGRVMDLPFEELDGLTQAELDAVHDRTDLTRERVATADHVGLAAMPRTMLQAVGGNDERFDYWGKEDLDLAARLKRAGCSYHYDERLKSFHISHPPNHAKEGDYLRMLSLLDENNARALVEANRGLLWGTLNAPPPESLDGTIIVEGGADRAELARRLEAVIYAPRAERYEVLVVCLETDRPAVEELVGARFRPLPVVSLATDYHAEHLARVLRHVRTKRLAFLPTGAEFDSSPWEAGAAADESGISNWPVPDAASSGDSPGNANDERRWAASVQWLNGLGEASAPANWSLSALQECDRKRHGHAQVYEPARTTSMA
jgi:glycosyltransferase involved in cell wall biosynthesis